MSCRAQARGLIRVCSGPIAAPIAGAAHTTSPAAAAAASSSSSSLPSPTAKPNSESPRNPPTIPSREVMQSWGLGWKRPSEIFHLSLDYGDPGANNADDDDDFLSSSPPLPTLPPPPPPPPPPQPPSPRRPSSEELGFRIDLDWTAGDEEEQIALRLQSQLMVALPPPQDAVVLDLRGDEERGCVEVEMKVLKRREPLRSVRMSKAAGSGQQTDGVGVLTRLIRSNLAPSGPANGVQGLADHWKNVTVLSLCGCGLSKIFTVSLLVLTKGENENLRRAIRGKPVGKQGLRILSMDGGGMKGLATVQMLKQIEQGTGKRIHEMFDLICGTSTGGMLAVALGIKQMTLDQCEDIYKELGEYIAYTKFYMQHSADQFERLLKEMCADEDGDLLIESAVKGIPKVFVVSTLVSVTPAQPFLFRNYQYPAGTPESPLGMAESPAVTAIGTAIPSAQIASRRGAFIGSCKHRIWEAIRASSAAPYYLDDFSDGNHIFRPQSFLFYSHISTYIHEVFVPTKVRKGGWRYLDTGQVLIESACSVDRVEEALDTLLPMIPEVQYFRFNPVDERCDMELDETDPAIWLKLEAATEEYIQKNCELFKNVCDRLVPRNEHEERLPEKLNGQQFSKSKLFNSGTCQLSYNNC
ncbi:hypothetical protein BHE74_00044409 [Ensete ventricosum]|nr:hypothetical protein BHE74_00044409 [Ensete ventricosum]